MLEHLRSMAVFAEVVDKGSFRGAAASLGLSPSVISHHVSQLELSVSFDDRPRNLIADGFDLGMRIGWLEDSGLKARKLLTLGVCICASPGYLADRKRITRPEDLAAMDWISMAMLPNHLDFTGPDEARCRVECPSRISVDSATAAKGLALAGMGLVSLLELDVKAELADNRLREVLPDWKTPSPGVYALWPANATRTALSRRFVDFLAENALPRRRDQGVVPGSR